MGNRTNHNNEKPENRDRIFEYIQNNQGVHLRMIVRELELAMGTTQHHLNLLEKSGRIKSRRMNLRRHYYTFDVDDTKEIILAFLKHEAERDILIYLVEHPNSIQNDIVKFVHVSAPTINWHMTKLIEGGLVSSEKKGRTITYQIKGNAREITNLLKLYHPTIWNKMLDRLADMFLQLSETRKIDEDDK